MFQFPFVVVLLFCLCQHMEKNKKDWERWRDIAEFDVG